MYRGYVYVTGKCSWPHQRLSPDCEDQIRVILQESALDYRLDPQLQVHCTDEVSGPRYTAGLGYTEEEQLPLPTRVLQCYNLGAHTVSCNDTQVHATLRLNK